MLTARVRGAGDPVLFFLHFLGGSGREWDEVVGRLEGRFRCVAVDLPGFGDSAEVAGYSVEEMADAVMEVVRAERANAWVLVGHSMGAKVAAVLARCAEDGVEGLAGLRGVVTLAGSPPGPEPMEESRREGMLRWFKGDAEKSRREATKFIEANVGGELAAAVKERAVEDVLRMKRAAWVAWLESGSKEDWSGRVGVLRTPALVVAGERDEDLGPEGQRAKMLPHFATVRMEVLAGARHLLPMERAEAVARLIGEFAATGGVAAAESGPEVDAGYLALIESERVSARTREVLLERAAADDAGYEPRAVSVEELAVLRAVMDRVVPQEMGERIDLAARLDKQLAEAKGDGWRYDLLPGDAEAYRAGLRRLEREAYSAAGKGFAGLSGVEQDGLLEKAAAGALGAGLLRRAAGALGLGEPEEGEPGLDAEQMRLWFEEVRADAVRCYVGHPATLARMGYSGIGDGADAATMQGFVRIGMGERESWEPVAQDRQTEVGR